MIKVMLVDDQNLVRKGVRSLLELSEEIEVVAEAADGAEAIRMVPEVAPDVVLLDLGLEKANSLELMTALQSRLPATRIIAMDILPEQVDVTVGSSLELTQADGRINVVTITEVSGDVVTLVEGAPVLIRSNSSSPLWSEASRVLLSGVASSPRT